MAILMEFFHAVSGWKRRQLERSRIIEWKRENINNECVDEQNDWKNVWLRWWPDKKRIKGGGRVWLVWEDCKILSLHKIMFINVRWSSSLESQSFPLASDPSHVLVRRWVVVGGRGAETTLVYFKYFHNLHFLKSSTERRGWTGVLKWD